MNSKNKPQTTLFDKGFIEHHLQRAFDEINSEFFNRLLSTVAKNIESDLSRSADTMGSLYRIKLKSTVVDDMERHIRSLESRLSENEAIARGECIECKRYVRGWSAPKGAFAPEAWAILRENGIDPATGHSLNCRSKHKDVK